MPTLRDLISDGKPHVLDGAMGTILYGRGVFLNVCYDELSLRQPDLVRDIHRDYVKAGAEAIETNTFGANPLKLAHHGLAAETGAINRAAAQLARDAAGARAAVLGAIGPLGVRIEPFGELGAEEAETAFGAQVDGLLAGGVDGFIIETFSDVEEVRSAITAIRRRSDLPIIAQMTVGTDGKTYYGTGPATFGPLLEAMGADVVGVNCSVGPHGVLDAVEALMPVVTVPISAQPNAGLPREVGDRKIYMASPEYMATYAKRIVEAGARFIGGCCGTTPEHIKEMVAFVKSVRPRHSAAHVVAPELAKPVPTVPLAERSRFGGKLARGEFIRTVEIVPPKGVDPGPMFDQARALKAGGVDAINVPDGPRAQSRMGALLSGLLIQREVGIEAVVHYACRDRNLLGMLSDLLGAAASGVRNLLIVTGDPPKMGPYPDATAVFDIDSIGLANLVHRLNQGLDPGGNAIGAPSKFVIGVGVNPAAVELDRELRRFAWKVDAGAEFAVTQPVFDLDQLDAFLRRVEAFRIPIIAGIWPLVSLRNAEFLANEVPGVTVPPEVLERMRAASAKGKEAALAEGVAIAQEMLAAVKQRVQGAQVAAPLGRAEVAVRVFTG
ncbi:MAG: bifunctional homocysteine S-methyltransferase/methylenetetrahydrofolate reductase [Gemmatimonadota bacterium]|nr:bifunctional homocysteine S-methyltransferase/methylenetetrahydrofolate reductase [Gemmatimonadota bacterium]MDH4348439.1 bifunctional homocysteine S-methyltransferase/methylenetetrahydrofolate reductase [Gemmatimonadota bacterium]MDH5284537.1 bifunctional homocysteine S-methyltransferase/methylenetetrahydrofolate reductase [Gemmatimonadota bacterium]